MNGRIDMFPVRRLTYCFGDNEYVWRSDREDLDKILSRSLGLDLRSGCVDYEPHDLTASLSNSY